MERRRRRWWTFGLSVAAALVVAAATLSLASRLAFNAVPAYRARAQAWVSQALGQPARLGSIALTWRGLQPSLDLAEFEVLDSAGAVQAHAGRIRLHFSLLRLMVGDLAPQAAELDGVALQADIDAGGRWSLRGFGHAPAGGAGKGLQQLERLQRIRLVHCEALLHAANVPGAPLRFVVKSGELRRRGHSYRLQATWLAPAQLGGSGRFDGNFSGELAQPDGWHGWWNLILDDFGPWPGWRDLLPPEVSLELRGARLSLSGTLHGGRLDRLDLDLRAASVAAQRGQRTLARWDRPLLQAQASPQGGAWRAQLSRAEYGNAAGARIAVQGALDYRPDPAGAAWTLSLDHLRLDDLAPWLAALRGMPARAGDLGGELQQLELRLLSRSGGGGGGVELGGSARLQGVGLRGHDQQPGFSKLDGQLDLDAAAAHLRLQGAAPELELPALFARSLPFDAVDADIAVTEAAAGWHISAPHFGWKALGASGGGRLELELPAAAGQSPSLQLDADFAAADADALKPYILKRWGAGTREWLGRAIQGGRIEGGHIVLSGPLDDYPFVEHPDGSFALDFDVVGTRLDFARNWPGFERLRAGLKFRGHGLQIAGSGNLPGIVVERVDAQIPDLREAQLLVDGATRADAASYYAYLRASPLRTRLAGLLAATEAGGPAAVGLHLEIPLQQLQEQPDVGFSGRMRFDGGSLRIAGIEQPVQELRGSLQFGERGVRAERLTGRLYGADLEAAVRPEGDSPDGVVRAGFDAAAEPADGLLAAFLPDWLRERLHGSSHWSVRLPLSGAHSGQLLIETDLAGTASELPAPLAKAASEPLPLAISLNGALGGGADAPLRLLVDAGERLRLALRFGRQGANTRLRAADLRFGPGAAPRADEDGVRLAGSTTELDAGAWVKLLGASGGTGGALPFRGADLTVQRLIYGGLALRPTHLQASPAPDGWSLRADGAGATGTAQWSRGGGGAIQARLQRLALDPLAPPPVEAHRAQPFDPSQAPLLDFACDSMQMGEADLGRVGLRTQRIDGGQELQQLSIQGTQMALTASGRWTRKDASSSAQLDYSAAIQDAGKVLRGFGYAESLDARKADFSGRLEWPDQPDGLELAQARGGVTLKVEKGTLRTVNPGAGRVLGLLNLYALPRRLSLDFHDVVAKGLGFDSLHGSFALADGQAVTSDMSIKSPSMRMEMRGRIGLAARDYDQHVTVYPDVSTSVAVGATLIGGPIAGGVALLAQEIFNKPFNQLGHFSYHVTGSWDNPQISAGKDDAAPAPPGGPERKPEQQAPADQQSRTQPPGAPT